MFCLDIILTCILHFAPQERWDEAAKKKCTRNILREIITGEVMPPLFCVVF